MKNENRFNLFSVLSLVMQNTIKIFIGVCILLFSLPLFYILISQWTSFQQPLIIISFFLHCISSLLLGYFIYCESIEEEKNTWFVYTSFISFLIPFIGAVYALITFMIAYTKEKVDDLNISQEVDKYVLFSYKQKHELSEQELIDNIVLDKLDVQSINDIIRDKDPEYQRGVIDKLSLKTDKESIGYLKLLLKEEDYEIRLYANVALKKIEDNLNKRVIAAKDELLKTPNSVDKLHGLVLQYYILSNSGILDDEMIDYYMNHSIHYIDEAIKLDSQNETFYLSKAKCLILTKKYTEALNALDHAIQINQKNKDAYTYRAEVYFHLKRYELISSDTNKLLKLKPKYEKQLQIANFWGKNTYVSK